MKPEGTVVPLIRLSNLEVPKVLEHIRGDISGVLVGGRAGNGVEWDAKQLGRAVKASKSFDNSLYVYAGIWFNDEGGYDKAKAAQDAGADYLVVPVPKPSVIRGRGKALPRLINFYSKLADHGAIEKPLIVYAHPDDHYKLELDTICELAAIPGIEGIKISYNNAPLIEELSYRKSVEEKMEDFGVFVGNEQNLFLGYLFGADGNVSTIGHVASGYLREFIENMGEFRDNNPISYVALAGHINFIMGEQHLKNWDQFAGCKSGLELKRLKQASARDPALSNALDLYSKILEKGAQVYHPNVQQGVREALKREGIL